MSGRDTVRDALRLRLWALRVLAGLPADPTFEPAPRAWERFFEGERCGLPLSQRLAGTDSFSKLPSGFAVRIGERADRESRRVAAARRHLATIAEAAQEGGWRVAALKGSAIALDPGAAIDLADVDVLIEPDAARSLAAALGRRGYLAAGGTSPRHLSRLSNRDVVPVEIHVTVDRHGAGLPQQVWEDLRPLEHDPRLYRLPPKEHLDHVLSHAAIDHPDRRGHIRDLLLIGSAAAPCSASDLADIEARFEGRGYHDVCAATLAVARDLQRGLEGDDPLRRVATTGYALRELLASAPLPGALAPWVHHWAFAWILGARERRVLLDVVGAESLDPSGARMVAGLEKRRPLLGRVSRVAARSIRTALAAVMGLPVAAAARRVANRAAAGL